MAAEQKGEAVKNRASVVAVTETAANEAAKIEEEPETPVDTTSLLDVVIEEYNLEKDKRGSRILITGLIQGSTTAEHLQQLHDEFMANIKKDTITGACFLIDDTAFAHVMEASSDTITQYLRLLHANTSMLTNVQICSLSEEIPREFNVWAFRSITLEDSGFEKGDMDWLEVIFGALEQFLELGKHCSQMNQAKAVQFLQVGTDKKTLFARLPTVSQIKSFQKCPDLFGVKEWLELFDVPIEFTLEGEKVWPVDPPLRY